MYRLVVRNYEEKQKVKSCALRDSFACPPVCLLMNKRSSKIMQIVLRNVFVVLFKIHEYLCVIELQYESQTVLKPAHKFVHAM